MILYFSGNGNSEHVARQLARLTDDKAYSLVEGWPSETDVGVLGVVFPVHAWGLPRIVEQFFREMPPVTPLYIYTVCTCGDDVGRTDRLVRRLFDRRALTVDAIWSVRMGNTYIALPGFDIDRDEVVCRKMADLPRRLEDIADKVNCRCRGITDVVPGALPGVKSYVLRPLFYRFLTGDSHFRTTADCIGCGKCATDCPTHNIHLVKGYPQWQGHCTDCLRCYHRCPVHAIRYGCWSGGKGQYHVTMTDPVVSGPQDSPTTTK